MVVLESSLLRIHITRDRAQILLSFQPVHGKRSEWFSLGLLYGLIRGSQPDSEVLDDDWARFLESGLPDLEHRLNDPKASAATIEGLREQARIRAKALFG